MSDEEQKDIKSLHQKLTDSIKQHQMQKDRVSDLESEIHGKNLIISI